MSDSFATWDGPRVIPPTTGREAHTNPEDDPALLRSELAACRREIDRLRTELAEARAELLRRDHAIGSLLAYTENHRVTMAAHDHDCYERWCIERDHARLLIGEGS